MYESQGELGFLGIFTNHKMVDDDENDDGGVSDGVGGRVGEGVNTARK